MIGALVESDKPVVVNSGSFGGSNSSTVNTQGNPNGRDVGFDQIVPFEKTGKEYIFVKGKGTDELERVLLIAHKANTIIYLNGSSSPFTTLINAGDYVPIDGSQFNNGNLYVTTSENVFAYQSIGGIASPANQNLFFVPPLNCATPNTVDNIPYIDKIGGVSYSGTLNIVTETGATVLINGSPIGISPVTITVPNTSTTTYERYTVTGLSGNVSVKSTKQVYVSYFGTNNAATYGGYYSGFDTKPEITSEINIGASSSCIPNVVLKVNSITAYDTFEWFFNDVKAPGISNQNTYAPTQPGFYQVKGSITGCSSMLSDKIPVSSCSTDIDNDSVNDNIDLDNDNDGITNCTESYGNQNIDVSNAAVGTIAIGGYSNSFTGVITATGGTFTGSTDGSFITEVPAGKGNSVTYKMDFDKPISLGLEYITTANTTDLLNADAEYVVNSDIDKTITVLNPDNQLLIDTNYDGVYESGVTQFSSFEIRFRLNSTTPLAAGTGTFKFLTYLTNSISFTHKNLSDSAPNKSTLKFFAVCVPKDSDGDGVADQLDLDSDNDGIPDNVEAQGKKFIPFSNKDLNKDGLDDAYGTGINPVDSDTDGVLDYLDLDSDNDGIYDLVESGSSATDANNNGIIDGNAFGTNGLSDSLETPTDSGVLKYSVSDTDGDGIKNYIDLDSDNDGCNDVVEAGFTDSNGDGLLGNIAPPTVNGLGIVTSGNVYKALPNNNYIIAAPISITSQPVVSPTCELQNATITLVDNGGNTYQWQIFAAGSWNDLANDDATYAGTKTNTLSITSVKNAMNGYKYRVQLNKTGNSCGLPSAETALTVYALPVVNNVTIIQCDDDADGITQINLKNQNSNISLNYKLETFKYYTSKIGATKDSVADFIQNDSTYVTASKSIWSRIINKNGCYSIAEVKIMISAPKVSPKLQVFPPVCDDNLDINGINNANNNKRDGIATFDFSGATANLGLPFGYSVTYYRKKEDAESELNPILDPSHYRNIGYPSSQDIWGRVNSPIDNSCFGLGHYVTVNVEKLPFANPVTIPRQCDDNQDGIFTFNTSNLETTLLGTNQTFPVTVTYFDAANSPLKDANGILITSPFPATFTTKSQTIKAVVTNNSALKCFDETLIVFTVDDLPEAFPIPVNLTTVCDDEINPLNQDGKFAFDTSTFEATILGGQTGMTVKYFDNNGNPLSSPLPNPFITGTQNITVIVENPINTSCSAKVILPFTVNPLPNINLNTNGSENELVCSNLPAFFVKLDSGIQDGSPANNYTYVWSKDGTVLPGEKAPTLDVNAEGIYTVEVITLSGCSRIRTIKVTASDVAHIENIVIVDLTDVNSVTVNVSGQGKYEYSLDEPYGSFQLSNFFDNVPAGIHEVFINDINGCGTVSKTISIIGVPKYFTPNGDGYNDYWNVKGVNASFNSNSTIYIFDRYGKLLKQIVPSSQGWDGTFNGTPLPSDDYWYTVKLEDGREVKGHFSLKR